MNELAVLHDSYHAGNQMCFPVQKRLGQDTKLHHYGCGVIAMTDFCVYKNLVEKAEDSRAYMELIRHMERHYMHVLPGVGISPYFYVFLANRYFRARRSHYRLGRIWLWGSGEQREKRLVTKIAGQLKADFPLIFAAGPVFPGPWRYRKIPLYRLQGGHLTESGQKVKSHYMTILGLYEDQGQYYVKVATWGEIRYMRLRDYRKHAGCSIPFSNTVYAVRMIRK